MFEGLSDNSLSLNERLKSLTSGVSPDALQSAIAKLQASGAYPMTPEEAQKAMSLLSPADVADAFETIASVA